MTVPHNTNDGVNVIVLSKHHAVYRSFRKKPVKILSDACSLVGNQLDTFAKPVFLL